MYKCFLPFNEGLPRRFPNRWNLTPYSDKTLAKICINSIAAEINEVDIIIKDYGFYDNSLNNYVYYLIRN